MWISIFELLNGDIESVELFWDKQICYESTFASEYGLDSNGYVNDDDWGLGRHRIIEIKDEPVNKMFMFILHQYIINCDKKYLNTKICGQFLKEWI